MNKEKIILVLAVAVVAGGLVWAGSLLNTPGTIINQVGEKFGAVSNVRDLGPEMGQLGLQTGVVSGSFKNSTTTFIFFTNPFPGTSTLDLLSLHQTGLATTTFSVSCGTTRSGTRGTIVNNIVAFGTVATSTSMDLVSNNTATSTDGGYSGGSVNSIKVAGSQNISCIATFPTGYTDVTFANNATTFAGKFWARFVYSIR